MRFHLIDRITDYTSWKVAKGFKNITKSDELISNNKDKRIKYSNNLLCESVFQTLAWLIVKSSQQTKRPVILSIEELSYFREVLLVDRQIITEVSIDEIQEEVIICSGKAYIEDSMILSFSNCLVSLLDTTDLEDCRATEAMLDVLYTEE